MDGRPDACAHCGAPLLAPGRFCSTCGAPVAPVTLSQAPATPSGPAAEPATAPEVDPYEALYASPAAPATPPPVVAPVVPVAPLASVAPPPPPAYDEAPTRVVPPPPGEPLPADPVPPRGSPGPGLWIGAAVLLVGVLLLGSYLLLHGTSGSPSASSTPPIVPKQQHSSAATSTAPSSRPASSSAAASTPPPGAVQEVAGQALASAPRHAPPAVDFGGQPVTYVPANMVDGRSDTCWRVVGDASGMVLTFRLAQPTTLTRVGIINGYDKVALSGGHPYDWYAGNRRVLAVDWVFDDGTTVSQPLAFSRTMQQLRIDPVQTQTVRLRITSVSPPGQGRAARDDTAVSEVSLRGSTG